MKINLRRVDDAFRLEATNHRGDVMYTDGSVDIGAGENGWRPMETLLISLAGCSAIDVISILKKQRQTIEDFQIEIDGDKKTGGPPTPYSAIRVHYKLKGAIKSAKMEKAIELTRGKYCSVYFSLHPDIDVSYTYEIEEA